MDMAISAVPGIMFDAVPDFISPREIHRTLPCFIENETLANDAGMGESVLRAMQKAYDHVAAVCIGEREDIHMIERSEIYAGEA